jgi:hypothetical protein
MDIGKFDQSLLNFKTKIKDSPMDNSPAHFSYLPEVIRKDYLEAQADSKNPTIKSLADWANYRGIAREDLDMLRREAQSQKRSQMAMRNDPDARVGEIKKGYLSYNPEYTTELVTDNPLEKLGRLKPPGDIETYENPIWNIPYIKENLRMRIGEGGDTSGGPRGDTLKFPVGEPKIQAHEYMHRGSARASPWVFSQQGVRGFIGKEIIQGPLGDQSTYSNFAPLHVPTMAAEHVYIMEKTAPEFFTDKTDNIIKTMDKQERDTYLKNNFSKLFPEYKDEEKFAAFRKQLVNKVDQYIENNPDKVFTKQVNKAYPKK